MASLIPFVEDTPRLKATASHTSLGLLSNEFCFLASVPPRLFLAVASPLTVAQAAVFTPESYPWTLDSVATFPVLEFDVVGNPPVFNVSLHDGRHRMKSFAQHGIPLAPVLVVLYRRRLPVSIHAPNAEPLLAAFCRLENWRTQTGHRKISPENFCGGADLEIALLSHRGPDADGRRSKRHRPYRRS